MQYALIFVLLLTFVLGLGLIARRTNVPYPILFVIGGLFIGFIPILPQRLELNPDFVFFVFLPPLLYIQAFYTSWRDFKFYLRSIMLLAIGLVLVTTIAVAYVAHWMIPNLPLAATFVLGAIVSPPDAIAASAIAKRLGLPRRVITILEGESLVNDATSLVLFKVALAAIGATLPLIGGAWIPGEFIYVATGGIVVGLVMGWVIGWVRQRLADDGSQILLIVSLLTPYLSYLFADQFLHVSGVLSVVATGLYLGWIEPEVTASGVRLQAQALWDIIIYLLNGMVFVLIGLQLPHILRGMQEYWWPWPLVYALVINLVCLVVRVVWIFPGAYLPLLLSKRLREAEGMPDWRQITVIGWSGMRGIVSLAAPLTLQGYPKFPLPHLVQFLVFSVIFAALVVQGLTLPALIRWLGLGDDGISAQEEVAARARMSEAAFEKILELRGDDKFPVAALETIERVYRERLLVYEDAASPSKDGGPHHSHIVSVRRLRRMMIATQRRSLVAMRRNGDIADDVLHKIEHELDLEEERL